MPRKNDDARLLRNNFDLLRFILAGAVVLFHTGVLSGSPTLRSTLLPIANGHTAVLGFFAISGYVVTLSWLRLHSWREYARRRALRLLPAYFAVVLFCWIAGAAVSRLPWMQYWRDPGAWRYLLANLTFLQFLEPSLPGVFDGNPVMSAVNGSLWSIRAELLCYALAPLLSGARWWAPGLMAVCLAAEVWPAPALSALVWMQMRIGILQPTASFALGVMFARAGTWAYGPAGVAGLLLLSSYTPFPWRETLEPAALAAAVMALGLAIPYLGRWTMLGNLSYGIYLWHFPIVQWLTAIGWANRPPWLFLTSIAALTLACAMLSWHLVEKRFLAAR